MWDSLLWRKHLTIFWEGVSAHLFTTWISSLRFSARLGTIQAFLQSLTRIRTRLKTVQCISMDSPPIPDVFTTWTSSLRFLARLGTIQAFLQNSLTRIRTSLKTVQCISGRALTQACSARGSMRSSSLSSNRSEHRPASSWITTC